MQPSPIQLKVMQYLRIKVFAREFKADNGESVQDFDFLGVSIGERIGIAVMGDKENPTMFAVRLHITIDNEEGKVTPYDVDVEVVGSFAVSENIPKDNRENLVLVNGCSILYSAIRDQVMTLSARCHHGPMILPTVNFLDKVKKTESENQTQKKRPKKKTEQPPK